MTISYNTEEIIIKEPDNPFDSPDELSSKIMTNTTVNVAITKDREERDAMLEATNNSNVITRPAWMPMHMLKINQDCQKGDLKNTEWLFERLVNVPSSPVNI